MIKEHLNCTHLTFLHRKTLMSINLLLVLQMFYYMFKHIICVWNIFTHRLDKNSTAHVSFLYFKSLMSAQRQQAWRHGGSLGFANPPYLLPLPEQSLPSCKPDPVTWLAAWGYCVHCLRASRVHVSTQGRHLCTEQSHFRQCNRLLQGLEQLLLDRANCVVNV